MNNNKKQNRVRGLILAGILLIGGAIYFTKVKNESISSIENDQQIQPVVTPIVVSQPEETTFTVNSSGNPQIKEKPVIIKSKSIKRLSVPTDRLVVLLGQVGENALNAAALINNLSLQSSAPIYLVLSGPGGSVVTGSMLISAIQASKAPVYTICDVLCASMDAMIHQYGVKRYMTDRTIIMFHPASAGTSGDVDRMYSMSSFLKRYTNKMELEVSNRQGITFEQYKLKTSTELWIDAEDALEENITDGIISFTLPGAMINRSSDQENKRRNKVTVKNPIDFQWICTADYCQNYIKGIK